MGNSAVPAAIDALVGLVRAAPALTDAGPVHDGPPTSAETSDYICIGHDPADPTSAEATQTPGPLSRGLKRNEEFEIIGCVVAWGGIGTSFASLRATAYDRLAAIEDLLRANVTLDGAVKTAQLTAHSLLQEAFRSKDSSGNTAGIRFRISCEARI